MRYFVAVLSLLLGEGCAHQVTFDSIPTGASVLFDGVDAGTTPFSIEDRGSLGGNRHSLEVAMPGHDTVRLDLNQSLRPNSVLMAGAVGVGGSLLLLGAGTALLFGVAAPPLSLVGVGLCAASPLGVAAGCPVGAHAWQLGEDSYVVADFDAQDRNKALVMAARGGVERSKEAARAAAEKAKEAALAKEARWVATCAGESLLRTYAEDMTCGDRALAVFDQDKAVAFWAGAASKASGPSDICKPAQLIKANTTHPELALKGVSQMIIEQCRDKETCLIHCQSVSDSCRNTPVQTHLLDEHTAGCEVARLNCEHACMK